MELLQIKMNVGLLQMSPLTQALMFQFQVLDSLMTQQEVLDVNNQMTTEMQMEMQLQVQDFVLVIKQMDGMRYMMMCILQL